MDLLDKNGPKQKNRCAMCHRLLRDELSIRHGLGPVCRLKRELALLGVSQSRRRPKTTIANEDQMELFKTKAQWAHHEIINLDVVALYDVHDPKATTVADDATAVITALSSMVGLPGKRVIYRDRNHMWHLMVIKDGALSRIEPLNCSNMIDAIDAIGAR